MLSLGRGPICNGKLRDIFEINLETANPGPLNTLSKLPLTAGIRENAAEDRFVTKLDQRHILSRRFMLARLIADFLDAEQKNPLLTATSARTSRQKFQRSFAQEFLCPLEDLMEFLGGEPTPDQDDIDDAAAFFDVSPMTVSTTLVNNGYLNREQVFKDLEG